MDIAITLGTSWEQFDSGESLDTESLGKSSLSSGINLSNLDFTLKLAGSTIPFGLQLLAVTAPGSIEFDQPDVIALSEDAIEVAVSQDNNILIRSRT